MNEHWSSVFAMPSATDDVQSAKPSAVLWSGGVSTKDGQLSLAAYFNLLLEVDHLPEHLAYSQVVFLPKMENPSTPDDFWPVLIVSIILHAFHKILARQVIPLQT